MNQHSRLKNTPETNLAKVVRGSILPHRGPGLMLLALGLLLLPDIAFAQGVFDLLDDLIYMADMLIPLLIGCAVIMFFWGLIKFIAHADDEKAVAEGKQFMLWGMIGLFVVVALWSIVGFVQRELGLDSSVRMNAPTLPTRLP